MYLSGEGMNSVLEKPVKVYFGNNLEKNVAIVERYTGCYADMVVRWVDYPGGRAAVIYFDGMTDTDAVSEFIVKPLIEGRCEKNCTVLFGEMTPEELARSCMFLSGWQTADNDQDFMDSIYSGNCGILFQGSPCGLVTDIKGFERRGISEPQTEIVVRGSREGFIENIKSNMAMLRRRIKTPGLCFEMLKSGSETNTGVCVAYIRGLADDELICEVKRRIEAIKTDAILESGYIEQLIEDAPFSPFPTIANSEKPDKVAAKLLEGRVAILVDGTPFVLTVPMLLVESFQSAEDYYSRPYMASMVRLLRFLSFGAAVYGPALYIVVTGYHPELIPSALMLNMWQSAGSTPLSVGWSVFFYSLVYEVVREAGIRLPRPVGAAISIVGGLVIGSMAVEAGLISAPVVMIVAFAAIAMFVVDALTDAATLLRFAFIFLAWWSGVWGIMVGTMLLLLHLVSLHSWGVPYFAPFVPFYGYQLRDTLVRFPLWLLGRRPENITIGSRWRQYQQKPPAGVKKSGDGDGEYDS